MKLLHTACAFSFLLATFYVGTQAASTTPSSDTTAGATATMAATATDAAATATNEAATATDAAATATDAAATATDAAATATDAAATATNAAATATNAAATDAATTASDAATGTGAANTATDAATDAATTAESAAGTGTAASGTTNGNTVGLTDAATTMSMATTETPMADTCYHCNSTTDASCISPNSSTPNCTNNNTICLSAIDSSSGEIVRSCNYGGVATTCESGSQGTWQNEICGYCCTNDNSNTLCNTKTLTIADCKTLIGSSADRLVSSIPALVLITIALQRVWS